MLQWKMRVVSIDVDREVAVVKYLHRLPIVTPRVPICLCQLQICQMYHQPQA